VAPSDPASYNLKLQARRHFGHRVLSVCLSDRSFVDSPPSRPTARNERTSFLEFRATSAGDNLVSTAFWPDMSRSTGLRANIGRDELVSTAFGLDMSRSTGLRANIGRDGLVSIAFWLAMSR